MLAGCFHICLSLVTWIPQRHPLVFFHLKRTKEEGRRETDNLKFCQNYRSTVSFFPKFISKHFHSLLLYLRLFSSLLPCREAFESTNRLSARRYWDVNERSACSSVLKALDCLLSSWSHAPGSRSGEQKNHPAGRGLPTEVCISEGVGCRTRVEKAECCQSLHQISD